MSQLLSNGVSKTVPEVVITYQRKKKVNRGGTSMLSDLQEAIPPKKDAGGSIVASVGEGLGRNFVDHDIPPPPKHFQISMGRPSVPNAYERKRKRKPVRLIVSPATQGDASALIAPEMDVDASVVMVEDAGDLVVEEVLVNNFVNQDAPPSAKHLQASVDIPPSPNTCQAIEQLGLNLSFPLQVDASTLIAPKEVEASVAAVEDAGDSAIGEVSERHFTKRKNKDIGWNHGKRVGGNSYHWQCNWCGIVRWGGVCRLKQHLAGAPQVRKCPEVPEHVAETVRKHLNPCVLKAIDALNSRIPRADGFVCKDHFSGSDRSERKASRQFSKGNKRLKIVEKQSETITQRSEMAAVEASEEPPDASPDGHWRKALEHMLQLPYVKDGGSGGIESCIHSVLRSGPSECTTKSKLVDISGEATDPKDQYKDNYKLQDQAQRLGSSAGGASDISKSGPCGHADVNTTSLKCQNVMSTILSSKNFVSLCDLTYGTFRDKKASEMLDFSLINKRMLNGEYGRSPELFDQDIEQVWERILSFGQEMMLLASNLSNISPVYSQKQVAEGMVCEVGEQIFEETGQAGVEQRNSMESNTIQYESDRSTKPELERTQTFCLYKICTCKQCGTDADIKHCLICDGCEAMYHLSCIVPAQKEIPTQSWYCAACVSNRKKSSAPRINSRATSEPINNIGETSEPVLTSTQPEGLHHNCVVCDRLEVCEVQAEANEIANMSVVVVDSTESSVSSLQSYELPEPSRTAMSRLCKKCGTCEDDDRRFLICAHTHCPYKFYHIRCLKYSQTTSLQKRNYSCWYCPSCLCRRCLSDKDDDQIVLCDSCDEGYHTYCMTPPLDSIPRGQWYCMSCTAAKAREGMRRYEQMILQQHGRIDARRSNEATRSMDILLSAVEKVSSEDRVTVGGE